MRIERGARIADHRLRWTALAAVLPLTALALAAHFRIPVILIDDAFITFRYAANWALGNGLVYNVSEAVLGTSTPGFALLLGLLAKLFGPENIPEIARSINAGAIIIAASALGWIVWDKTRNVWVSLFMYASTLMGPNVLLASVSGMESSVFLAALALIACAWINRYSKTAALLTGLMPLIRPEGVFVVGIVGAAVLLEVFRQKSINKRAILRLIILAILAAAPGALWAVHAVRTYGSFVPQSIKAKMAGLYPIGIGGSILSFSDWFQKGFTLTPLIDDGRTRVIFVGVLTFLIVFLITLVLIGFGVVSALKKHRSAGAAALWTVLLIVFFATSGTIVFPHYHALYEPFARVFWWLGLGGSIHAFLQRVRAESLSVKSSHMIFVSTGLIALLPTFILFPWATMIDNSIHVSEVGWQSLKQQRYYELAVALNPELHEGVTVLMPEIGELGFYLSKARVLDSAGLVSPEATQYFPLPAELAPGGIPPAMARNQHPDLIIAAEAFLVSGLFADPWFLDNYSAVIIDDSHRTEGDMGLLYVFSRNDYLDGRNLKAPTP